MKNRVRDLILQAAREAHARGALPSDDFPAVIIEEPKAETHGDFATNFAMLAAKAQRLAPRKIAEAVAAHLATEDILERVEIAGPGFINFFVRPSAWPPVIEAILAQDRAYGACDVGRGQKVQVEFVSANPTGPLHVGHGRGAAVGDSVARILAFCGYAVQREYYINDSGRQIQTLGRSVYLRCQQLLGQTVAFPEDHYPGDYILDIAREVIRTKGAAFIETDAAGAMAYCARFAADAIILGIRRGLEDFGITFDRWFSEQSLFDNGLVTQALEDLKIRGEVYSQDDALWFRSSAYGDEKDRVVMRGNGLTTYFAADIAYHREKFERGFDKVIDVWGADHHGYIPRMSAAVQAFGRRPEQFQVILVQLVNLLRGGQPVAMGKRSGEFVTLKEVVDEVGNDAARFIFLTRDYASPLDFDLEVAKQQTNENPVYYIQYVHARIASILRKAAEQGLAAIGWRPGSGAQLVQNEEIQLIKALARFPEMVQLSAETLAPHRITFALMNVSALFHAYYNKHRVLTDDPELSNSRLCLISAVQRVIRNGLTLLGVKAPEQM
jgi:arginyl-tRNA synthetase